MSSSVIPFIDLKAQYLTLKPDIDEHIQRVLDHGQYIMGPEVKELEDKLSTYTGSKYCITVSSGTEALLISLMALGIKPGDEIITTPFTFVATAEVIVLLGAIPVFVDVELDTCNIDAKLIESAITSKTKAIMPVSLYGQPADMLEINALASKYGLYVIEDAAQSFGAEYVGKKSCNLSTVGCTSFFPSKPLGCYGDGGAIFTSDDEIAQACREIRVHGQSKRYVHTRVGVGGRMDTLQCAILIAKFKKFDSDLKKRILIGEQYNLLLDNAKIQRVMVRNDRTSAFGQYTVFVRERNKVEKTLKDLGIQTAVHYPIPINEQCAYKSKGNVMNETPNSKLLSSTVLSLPMALSMTLKDQEYIVSELSKAMAK